MTADPSRLIAEHGPRIWALCRRLDPEPDDAYQAVWAHLLDRWERFDPNGSASAATWLLTVARRQLIDRHRRRTVRGPTHALPDIPAHLPAADDELADHERRQRLENAIAQLAKEQRRCVVLHHIEGLSLSDIAALEQVAIGTIKSRLHRGRAQLAVILRSAS